MENIDDMLPKIDDDTRYIILAKDYIAKIAPIDYLDENKDTEIFSPSSYVNFSGCENILRDYYHIYSPRKITFIQIELNNTVNEILVNQIEYQAYDDKNKILNLSICNTSYIKTYYSFKNDTEDKIALINYFKEKGIDILDINDNFFNDICIPYADSDNDLTLKDRIENIYKNYTLCEKNCQLDEILITNNMISCDCTVKENINVTYLNFNFTEPTYYTKNENFKMIKCINLFTTLGDDLNNFGFWTFFLLMLLNIVLLILYCLGLKKIKQYISRQMTDYGYIGKQDENHAFCHNYIKKLEKLMERLNNMKNNYIDKKSVPPKRKIHTINIDDKSGRNDLIKIKKIIKVQKSKKDLEKNIELVKSRMGKTEKIKKNNRTTSIELLKSSKHNLNGTLKSNNSESKNNIDNKINRFNNKDNFNLNLININVKELNKDLYIPNESEQILNIYNFEEALTYDKRSLFQIYYIFLIAKQVIMHAIFYKSPIEPLPIRLSLLKFMLGCDLALNAIFYTDSKISEKYNSTKNVFVLGLTNNIVAILLSTLIGYVLFIFLGVLNNSTNAIRKIFRDEEDKIKKDKDYKVTILRRKEIIIEVKKIMKNFNIKVIIFYIIEFLCMIFFWYYVTVFYRLYKKTLLSWLIDCLITIIIRIILDLLLNLLLSFLYSLSITSKSNYLFRVMIFLYCFA